VSVGDLNAANWLRLLLHCRDNVIERIEQLAASLVADVAGGRLPQLTCISTAASNVHMAPRHARAAGISSSSSSQPGDSRLLASQAGTQQSGDAGGINELRGLLHGLQPIPASTQPEGEPDGDLGDTQQQQGDGDGEPGSGSSARVLRLGSKVRTLSLTASNGQQASSIMRGEWHYAELWLRVEQCKDGPWQAPPVKVVSGNRIPAVNCACSAAAAGQRARAAEVWPHSHAAGRLLLSELCGDAQL
jgi:hypothetical protein